MPSYCGVFGCKNNSKRMPGLSYFNLPKNKKRFKKWIELIGRKDIVAEKGRYYVCSLHFGKDMFVNKRLKPDSYPSLNLPKGDKSSSSIPVATKKSVETQTIEVIIPELPQVQKTTASISTQVQPLMKEKETQTLESNWSTQHQSPAGYSSATSPADFLMFNHSIEIEDVKEEPEDEESQISEHIALETSDLVPAKKIKIEQGT